MTVTYGNAAVTIENDDAAALEWLTAFLTPWVTVGGDDGSPRAKVTWTSHGNRFAEIVGQLPASTDLVPTFSLDQSTVSLPGVRLDSGHVAVQDQRLQCVYVFGDRRVEIIAPPHHRRSWLGLMRVVREILTCAAAAEHGIVDLHAAAFAIDGRAVLLAGPKEAGKTTLLCHALSSRQTALLANDRVIVDGGTGEVRGVPSIVSVRDGTLGWFPALRRSADDAPLLEHPIDPARSQRDGETVAAPTAPRGFACTPRQLAERLGATCVAAAPIAAVLFPEIDPDAAGCEIDELPTQDAAERLEASRYGINRDGDPPTVIGSWFEPRGERLVAATLGGSFAMRRCRLGPDCYRRPPDVWLAAVRQLWRPPTT